MCSQSPPPKQPAGIRADLDARANFSHYGGGFDDGHAVAGLRELKRSTQATKTTTDDDDIEGEGSLSGSVDGLGFRCNVRGVYSSSCGGRN